MDVVSPTPSMAKATEVSPNLGVVGTQPQATPLVYPNELWSSKALNLLWLPRDANWHNPCLLNVTSPVAGMLDEHDSRTTNATQWFWKVDLVFGAWVCRTSRRAEQAKRDINAEMPGVHTAIAIAREYLETVYPGCWDGIEKASHEPVVLDHSIMTDMIDFERFGLVPKWEGWDKAAERLALARGGSGTAGGAGQTTTKATKPTDSRDASRAKLF